MNSNFLNYILDDIDTKKKTLASMPIKTKTNIKKYNDLVDSILKSYDEYENNVTKYITAKSNSFQVPTVVKNNDIDNINNQIKELEEAKFLINPFNTFYEKLKFDEMLYELDFYGDYDFSNIYVVLDKLLDKFEAIGVRLTSTEFNYTPYVYDFMRAFLEVRISNSSNFERVTKIFEEIYWTNPDLVRHIVFNFKKLIRKHAKKFDAYLTVLQKKVIASNRLSSYGDCISRLEDLYISKNNIDKETIEDIVNKSLNGEINIALYLEGSKYRDSVAKEFKDDLDLNNLEDFKLVCDNLEKLKINIEEFAYYKKLLPLIDYIKVEFDKTSENITKFDSKRVKQIENLIIEKENKMDKLNKKVVNPSRLFGKPNELEVSKIKAESLNVAKELTKMYEKYDETYFIDKLIRVYSTSMTVSDFLTVLNSFEAFKRILLKKVFNLKSKAEVEEYVDCFNYYVGNPLNIISKGILIFDTNDIARIIINKYRLNNININEASLINSDLEDFLGKINLMLRVFIIKNSEITEEQIWFKSEVKNKIKGN